MTVHLRGIFERGYHVVWACFIGLLLVACGTGIEVTERVTDKDVKRVLEQSEGNLPTVTLVPFEDPLTSWKVGKRFWVADDHVRELLVNDSHYDFDTIHLAGHVLRFMRSETTGFYSDDDGRVNIVFEDPATLNNYVYRVGLPRDTVRPYVSLPMLIDLDMVDHVARQVQGKDFYIRTGIWYDRETEKMKDGRHFIKVHVDSVLPGNTVLPLRLLFTTVDTRERAMVWMSDNASTMRGRDFDALFVAADPHLAYPSITADNWELITRSQVVVGMTKEECRLAIGPPQRTSERPDQGGMREYWYYDGGSYLYFVDGLLSQFRR